MPRSPPKSLDPPPAIFLGAGWLTTQFASIRGIGEECVTEADLRTLLAAKPDSFRLYDGFEPSGRMHIAQVSQGWSQGWNRGGVNFASHQGQCGNYFSQTLYGWSAWVAAWLWALTLGTTSTRAVLFGRNGIVAGAQPGHFQGHQRE